MPLSSADLAVRGRDGRRIAMKDCNLEPLNLLIPGNAPIIVPKKRAWRISSQKNKNNKLNRNLDMEVAADDYEADSEEEDGSCDETQPLIKTLQAKDKDKAKRRSTMDKVVREKSKAAKHLRRAERHQKKADLEREEAVARRERLKKSVTKKQEAYILRLKARYEDAGKEVMEGTSSKKFSSKKGACSKKAEEVLGRDEGVTTDGSDAVRKLLANIKIRAGGKENPRFFVQPDDLPWNMSDDSQLLALKNGSDNSYAIIAECMGRRAGEVKRRYKYLKDCDFKIPGGNETTEAETTEAEKTGDETTDVEQTGEETTDVEHSGAEITDAEKTDNEKKDGGGQITDAEEPHDSKKDDGGDWTVETDTQLWKLKNGGKTWAEIHDVMGGSKSGLKDRHKHLRIVDFKVPDETTDAEDPGVENKDSAADATGNVMAMAPTVDEKQMEEEEEAAAAAKSSAKSKKTRKPSSATVPGQRASPSPSLPSGACCPSSSSIAGANAYIAQYARNLLAEANAGCTSIPEPDEIFDEDDCILLALADSRRRENRWMEIQADFYNVTGRMVPQEVLRWKLVGVDKLQDPDDYE